MDDIRSAKTLTYTSLRILEFLNECTNLVSCQNVLFPLCFGVKYTGFSCPFTNSTPNCSSSPTLKALSMNATLLFSGVSHPNRGCSCFVIAFTFPYSSMVVSGIFLTEAVNGGKYNLYLSGASLFNYLNSKN